MRLLAIFLWLLFSPALAQNVYQNLTVETLSSQKFDGGTIQTVRTMAKFANFTRYLIAWDSDGLRQYGFANIPTGKQKRAVVLVLHGYVNPGNYSVTTYTTRYADALARAGFVVVHPNYRGHPPSQGTANGLFRVGYALDVLYLLGSLRQQAGSKGIFATADATRVGLWGHSMGGGITHRVLVLRPNWVKAAVLYGAMSSDERENADRIYNFYSNQTRGEFEYNTPEKWLRLISPFYFLARVTAKISVHHGTADESVPYAWSVRYCKEMKRLGKPISCNAYTGAPHLFGRGSRVDGLFQTRVREFFASTL
jgi:uncharacterized protein